MKKLTIVLLGLAINNTCLLSSCTQTSKTDVAAQISEVERKYQDTIKVLRQELNEANSKIKILSFPADQRLIRIGELFNSGDFDSVKREASELKKCSPMQKKTKAAMSI